MLLAPRLTHVYKPDTYMDLNLKNKYESYYQTNQVYRVASEAKKVTG